MTEYDIQNELARYFDYRRNLIVPNVTSGIVYHECDLLVCTKAGYVTEVEIKISLADMKAEARKTHQHPSRGVIRRLFYAFPEALVEKCTSLVPEGAGIIAITKYGAHQARLAVPRPSRPLSVGEMYALARLGTIRIWDTRKAAVQAAESFAYLHAGLREQIKQAKGEG